MAPDANTSDENRNECRENKVTYGTIEEPRQSMPGYRECLLDLPAPDSW